MKKNLAIFGSIEFCQSKYSGKSLAKTCIGGNGTLSALAASKRANVDLIGVIGTDLDKKVLKRVLGKKVNIDNVLQLEGPSFHYSAVYDPKTYELLDEEIDFGVYGNCKPKVTTKIAKTTEYVLFSGSNPKYGLLVLDQIKSSPVIGFNTLLYHLKNNYKYSISLMKKASYLFINKTEYEYLQRKLGKNLFEVFKNLKMIFKTLGKEGVIVETQKGNTFFPTPKTIQPKNPTNAGDVFTGTIMGLLASGLNLEKELKKAINLAQKETARVLADDKFYRKVIL